MSQEQRTTQEPELELELCVVDRDGLVYAIDVK